MLTRKDLHSYQEFSVDHIINNEAAGLFLDMGLGKTVTSLTAIKILTYEELDIIKTLVIAPKRVVESVWEPEAKKWSHLKTLKFSKIIGSEKQRQQALAREADVYLISRDNIAWLCGLYGGLMLPFDMLVIDELSSFKSPKSLRFKALKAVRPSFKRVVGLTGTPAPNGLIDLWSQMFLLDRGERLGKTITQYRERYFKPDKRNGHIIYNYKLVSDGEKRIHEKIGDICVSMKAEDFLDLPKTIVHDIFIDLPEPIQKKYDDFEKELVLELLNKEDESTEISVLNAAALCNKLLQFANGAVYDEDKNYHVVHDLKLDAVEDLIEAANGKPVLIAWTYRHDLYRLEKRFKKYNTRSLKTDRDVLDWNNKKIDILFMHPASGGHGLNLQNGGNIIIWFGQTWSVELYQQLNARLDRQGQTEAVILYKLISRKTMDIDVVRVQNGKISKQNGLIDAVKAKINKYKHLIN